MKYSKAVRIQLPSATGPEDEDDKRVVYMSLWGWLDLLQTIDFIDEVCAASCTESCWCSV
jgi:hypothetical protein